MSMIYDTMTFCKDERHGQDYADGVEIFAERLILFVDGMEKILQLAE